MLVGLDFDNTIVSYDELFHRVALEQDAIPSDLPATKTAVRDYLRRQGQEDLWTEMQGYVYGRRMGEARAFPGVEAFFRTCWDRHIPVVIISHKTQHPYRGPKHDLHAAARAWLAGQSFLPGDWVKQRVFFEVTKEEKLRRIARQRCTHFVDDLPEFLALPGFPAGTRPILFSPTQPTEPPNLAVVRCWDELTTLILHEAAAEKTP